MAFFMTFRVMMTKIRIISLHRKYQFFMFLQNTTFFIAIMACFVVVMEWDLLFQT